MVKHSSRNYHCTFYPLRRFFNKEKRRETRNRKYQKLTENIKEGNGKLISQRSSYNVLLT